jgi:hypothetical protein
VCTGLSNQVNRVGWRQGSTRGRPRVDSANCAAHTHSCTHIAHVQCPPELIFVGTKQVVEVGLLPEQVLPICAVDGDDAATLCVRARRQTSAVGATDGCCGCAERTLY